MIKIKLINVGRKKYNGTAEVEDEQGILYELSRYLISSDIGLFETKEKNLFNVNVGFHCVGQVKIEKEW